MPELPEITLYKNYFDATSLNKRIVSLDFLHTGALQSPKKDFISALEGEKFLKTERLGKYLFIKTSGEKDLVMHFGMTGKLEYYKNQDAPKYTGVVFNFEDEGHLAYVCRRKLGKIFLTEGFAEFKQEHTLGEDALNLKEEGFLSLLDGKTGSIKGVLTDQHLLAGIGNVYSDEMLYQCKIHPKTKTSALSQGQKKQLYKEMRNVLELAIDKEGERSQFPEDYLIRHRKEGSDCPRGKEKIKMVKVSGRSTYFCPDCQKEEK